jgi:hypothetical protein
VIQFVTGFAASTGGWIAFNLFMVLRSQRRHAAHVKRWAALDRVEREDAP